MEVVESHDAGTGGMNLIRHYIFSCKFWQGKDILEFNYYE